MASSIEFVTFVCAQADGPWAVRPRKMFGDWMIYINDKPLLLVCDNVVYIKKLDCVQALLISADCGVPYAGAKEHYILDIDDALLTRAVITVFEPAVPLPRSRRKSI